jgi:hypothetical protein
MMERSMAGFILIVSFAIIFQNPGIEYAPAQIDQKEFKIVFTGLSEPGGNFDSDNFISNERSYLKILPELKRFAARGGTYIGVCTWERSCNPCGRSLMINRPRQTNLIGISLHAGC